MAKSSGSFRSFRCPYVVVTLKTADHSGQVKSRSLEREVPQFRRFYGQFKEISAVISPVYCVKTDYLLLPQGNPFVISWHLLRPHLLQLGLCLAATAHGLSCAHCHCPSASELPD
ncbi:COMM domain-containing protein 6-like [Rattus rattus]|uniref:COMM domain-containing protein 6-like n=1 Tax=Rattus rattus TaxID=10117 RepID=UPI0013F2DDDE|nr:COMM domain-containing protein 6-like [Rattus rattus]